MADERNLSETLDTIAGRIDALARSVDERFTKIDDRFAEIEDIDGAFADERECTEFAAAQIEKQVKDLRGDMSGGLGRLDRKLDRVINMLSGRPSRARST